MNLIKGADGNRDWNQGTKCNGNTAMMWEILVYLGWSSSGSGSGLKTILYKFQEATRIPIEAK